VLRVGLTGGIASGKTRVRERLAARGLRTLDLDQAARDVVAPGSEALQEIVAAFGARTLRDGALDRGALASLVFADAKARARLNAIVHPRIRELERRWTEKQPAEAVLVVDAALLVETGAHLRFDRLVVVHCDAATQLARLRARDGLDERSAQARMDAQMPVAQKREFAHFEVDSSGSLDETDRAADALADTLLRHATSPRIEPGAPIERLVGGLLFGAADGPRGLTADRLLRSASGPGGLELPSLASMLEPPGRGAWYEAADDEAPGAPASRLGVALAAWAHRRRSGDAALAVAAAGSVSRLFHLDAGSRTDACLVASVALARALDGGSEGVRVHAQRGLALASRFGGGPASGRLAAVWDALERHPAQPDAAAALAAGLGGDPPTAAGLAGLLTASERSPRSNAWQEVLEAL
jgi:dephospho-CoA kinase